MGEGATAGAATSWVEWSGSQAPHEDAGVPPQARQGWNPPPWEPPVAGDEIGHLVGGIHRQRATFRWKADGLDRQAMNITVGASDLTIAALLKHLALVEEEKFSVWLTGAAWGEPWRTAATEGHDLAEWAIGSAAGDSPAELYALYDGTVTRSQHLLAHALRHDGLDAGVHADFGLFRPSLRRMLFDVLEEYARHTGHADLIREAIDGRVGEDPPQDWRPATT